MPRPGTPCSPASRSTPDRRVRVEPPEDLGADHPDQVDGDRVEHHRLRGGGADADGSAAGGVAVITADAHDHDRHGHGFDQAEEEVGWVLEHPEDEEEAS